MPPLMFSDTGSSPAAIIDTALGCLGQKPLALHPPTSPVGVHCQTLYPLARDALLAMTDWSFATGWVTLTRLTTVPAARWRTQYAFPSNTPMALVVWELGTKDPLWERAYDAVSDRDVLYTDSQGDWNSITATHELSARCTFQVTDTNRWNPLVVNALVYKLAMDLSIAVTGQQAKWQAMANMMQFWLNKATGVDGKQRARTAHIAGGLVSIRGG